jgi:8-amino-7-oxononanoate synthase
VTDYTLIDKAEVVSSILTGSTIPDRGGFDRFAPYGRQLDALASAARRRALAPRTGHDFASNDYLGLATGPELRTAAAVALARGVPVGSGGSRLLRGNHPEHEALEHEAAAWLGAQAALFVGSGYAANVALLATLPQRGDLIVHDALVHASAHEGMRLARCERVAAAHNEVDAFAAAVRDWRRRGGAGAPWLVVESLYSMDGDTAPLAPLAELALREGGFLLVDEAHAGGALGAGGRGLAAGLQGGEHVVTLHTLGKALGCEGAIVALPAVLRDFLVNRARPFIFSTAPSPLIAAVARAAIGLVRDQPERRTRLAALARHAEQRLARHGVTPTGTHILPLVLGDDPRTMAVAARLQADGFDVRGIRPPTVPAGSARLRLSITLNTDAATIAALDAALERALA